MATPDSIATLSAWWRADSLGLSDAAAVSSWANSAAGGAAAVQATGANQPTLQTGEINGRPIVRFDGTNDHLVSTASASLAATTLVAVVKPVDVVNTHTVRGAGDGTSGSGSGALQYRISGGRQSLVRQATAEVGTTSNTTLSTTSFSIITATFTNATSYAFYLNGTADGGGSHAETLAPGAGTTIGFNRDTGDTGGEYLGGDLAELIIYSSVLSTENRSRVHSYLSDKYGITVSDYIATTTRPRRRDLLASSRRRPRGLNRRWLGN